MQITRLYYNHYEGDNSPSLTDAFINILENDTLGMSEMKSEDIKRGIEESKQQIFGLFESSYGIANQSDKIQALFESFTNAMSMVEKLFEQGEDGIDKAQYGNLEELIDAIKNNNYVDDIITKCRLQKYSSDEDAKDRIKRAIVYAARSSLSDNDFGDKEEDKGQEFESHKGGGQNFEHQRERGGFEQHQAPHYERQHSEANIDKLILEALAALQKQIYEHEGKKLEMRSFERSLQRNWEQYFDIRDEEAKSAQEAIANLIANLKSSDEQSSRTKTIEDSKKRFEHIQFINTLVTTERANNTSDEVRYKILEVKLHNHLVQLDKENVQQATDQTETLEKLLISTSNAIINLNLVISLETYVSQANALNASVSKKITDIKKLIEKNTKTKTSKLKSLESNRKDQQNPKNDEKKTASLEEKEGKLETEISKLEETLEAQNEELSAYQEFQKDEVKPVYDEAVKYYATYKQQLESAALNSKGEGFSLDGALQYAQSNKLIAGGGLLGLLIILYLLFQGSCGTSNTQNEAAGNELDQTEQPTSTGNQQAPTKQAPKHPVKK